MTEKEVIEVLKSAAEDARHELTTHYGLIVADGAAPEETWMLNPKTTIAKLDRALGLHADYEDERKRQMMRDLL